MEPVNSDYPAFPRKTIPSALALSACVFSGLTTTNLGNKPDNLTDGAVTCAMPIPRVPSCLLT